MPENNSNERGIGESLTLIQQAISKLDQKIEQQARRLDLLEGKAPSASASLSASVAATPPPPPPPPAADSEKEFFENAAAPAVARPASSFEENIGVKWFSRVGVTALVLGVSFFLKYAFDNDWIGETGRVMIGLAAGIFLLFLGEKTIRKYSAYGQMLAGGGIAVLYLSIFAAFDFYQLIPQAAAFFAMMIVTAAGILLSVRYDALSLASAAILGGFATPLLVSTGQNNQFALFSYVTLLDLAILVLSVFKRWHSLNLAGFLGTVILFAGWADKFYKNDFLASTMFFLTVFFLIYSLSCLAYNLSKREASTGIEQVLSIVVGSAYFAASYSVLNGQYHAFMGFFAVLLGLYYFLLAGMVKAATPKDANMYDFLAFLTVGFVTLAIPIQFNQIVVTIGWAIEAALLLWLGFRSDNRAIKLFGLAVFALAALRFLFVDAGRRGRDDLLIFNKVFLSSLFVIAAAYLSAFAARASKRDGSGDWFFHQKKFAITFLLVAANFLTIFSLSSEITSYYQRQISLVSTKQNEAARYDRNGGFGYDAGYYNRLNSAYFEQVNKLRNKSSISLSLFWLFYSILLIGAGIVLKNKYVRLGGLGLLVLAILKLFFYDLWSLGTLYRIISSISLGAVLLSISFVYQKYKDKIKEII